MIRLNELKINKVGIIESINCDEALKRRLLDLGLIPNIKITPLFKSPLGDPIAYEFRGNIIAIRNEEANYIFLKSNLS